MTTEAPTGPEAPAPASSEAAVEEPKVSEEALRLADVVDAHDVLNPRPTTTALTNLDPTAEFHPPEEAVEPVEETVTEPVPGPATEAPVEEAPGEGVVSVERTGEKKGYVITEHLTGKKHRVQIEGPVTVANMKAALIAIGETELAARTASIGPDIPDVPASKTEAPATTESDDDVVLDEAEQKGLREQAGRMKTIMQDLVKDPRIPPHLKADLIAKAAAGGIDLDPTKPLDEKKFTKGQKWAIGVVGTLLFMLMAVGAGGAAAAKA